MNAKEWLDRFSNDELDALRSWIEFNRDSENDITRVKCPDIEAAAINLAKAQGRIESLGQLLAHIQSVRGSR